MTTFRHVGIIVQDLEKQICFYTNVFDLQVIARNQESGEYISELVGVPEVVVSWAKLANTQGQILLELLRYESHPSKPLPPMVQRHGYSHVALTVVDVQATLDKLRQFGGYAKKHQTNPEGTVNVVYASDPEGIVLELVEDLVQ